MEGVCSLAQHTVSWSQSWGWSPDCTHCDFVKCLTHQRVYGESFIWADESKDTDIYLGIGTNLACVMSSPNTPLRRKFWNHVPVQPRKASPRSPCYKDKVSASEPSSTPLLCPPDSPLPSWAFWWVSWVSLHWACSKIQQIWVCRTSLCGRQKTRPHITGDVLAANLRHEIWPTEVLVVMVELYPIGRLMSLYPVGELAPWIKYILHKREAPS